MQAKEWNSRYVAYSAYTGMGPDERLAADKARHPGACMCEFIIWIGQQWREWQPNHNHQHTQHDHIDFDAWLFRKWMGVEQLELF